MADQVVVEEQTLEPGQNIEGLKYAIGPSASDAIVLEADCLQVSLVAKHAGELEHRVVIQVVIIQEDLSKSGVLL